MEVRLQWGVRHLIFAGVDHPTVLVSTRVCESLVTGKAMMNRWLRAKAIWHQERNLVQLEAMPRENYVTEHQIAGMESQGEHASKIKPRWMFEDTVLWATRACQPSWERARNGRAPLNCSILAVPDDPVSLLWPLPTSKEVVVSLGSKSRSLYSFWLPW